MTTETGNAAAEIPAEHEVLSSGAYEPNRLNDGVTPLERDIMGVFNRLDDSQVTYRNDWSANAVGGLTFADYDHDGWYDHLEKTDYTGSWLYCGNDHWTPL